MVDLFEAIKSLKAQLEGINGSPRSYSGVGLDNLGDSKKRFVNPDLYDLLDKGWTISREGCSLIRTEFDPISLPKLDGLALGNLDNKDAVILFDNKLFYVEQQTGSIKPITPTNENQDALEELRSKFTESPKPASSEELKLIANITGRVSLVDYASPEELESYSKKVLQAVWNICDSATSIFNTGLYSSRITQAFNYLDNETWVPRIVDERTYEIGKALQIFLVTALDEKTTGKPLPGRQNIEANLAEMKEKLDQRLKHYEQYQPDKLEESKRWFEFKLERQSLWIERQQVLINISKAADALIRDNHNLVQKTLDTEVDSLKKQLVSLQQYPNLIEQGLSEFEAFNKQWHRENLEENAPPSILLTSYTEYLVNKDPEAIFHWSQIYPLPSYENTQQEENIHVERIAISLDERFKKFEQYKKSLEELIEQLNQSIEATARRIADAEKLIVYQQELQNNLPTLVTDLLNIDFPECLQETENSVVLKVAQSTNKKMDLRLEEDIQSWSVAIKQLEDYRHQLDEHKKALLKIPSIPDDITLAQHRAGFEAAVVAKREQLQPHIDHLEQQINQATNLTNEAIQEKNHLQSALAKLSVTERKRQLTAIKVRVAEAYVNMRNYKKQVSQCNFDYQNFLQEEYRPNQQRNNNHFDPLLDEVNKKIDQRKAFLKSALDDLYDFEKVLENHLGLYIPADALPLEKLMQYLELKEDDTDAVFIKKLYEDERNNARFNGYNWSNFTNNLSFVLFGTSFYQDLETFHNIVLDKIDFMEEELAGNAEGPTPLKELEAHYQALSEQKSLDFAQWEATKTVKQQALKTAGIRHQLSELNHLQLLVSADCLALKYIILAIKDNYSAMDELLLKISAMNPDELLDYAPVLQAQLDKIKPGKMLSEKTGYHSKSADELNAHILAGLTTLKAKLNQLDTNIPELTETKKALQDQVNDLQKKLAKQTELGEKLLTLYVDSKESIQDQIKLAELQASSEQLVARFKAKNPDDTQLASDIKKFNDEAPALVKRLQEKNQEDINEKLGPILVNIDQLSSIESLLTPNPQSIPVSVEAASLPPQETFESKIQKVKNHFFGSSSELGGTLKIYLEERASTFSLRDLFSTYAAVILSCFNYKTESELRKDYIATLKEKVEAYEREPEKNIDSLKALIEQGLKDFSPRSPKEKNEKAYSLSLHAQLSALRLQIEEIELNPADVRIKPANSLDLGP